MDNKPFVFLAAADRDFVNRVKEALQGSVDLNVFDDGEVCRRALAAHAPQALILDTRLTGGYALHRAIRQRLVAIYGDDGAGISLLYGGSVNAANAAELLGADEVGGALVGGASLTAESFYGIILAASGQNAD